MASDPGRIFAESVDPITGHGTSSLHPGHSTADQATQGDASTNVTMLLDPPSDDEDPYPRPDNVKGKGKSRDGEITAPAGVCHLASLPAELISDILSYLTAEDLIGFAKTSRDMYSHAMADHLWQALIQDNVPGVRVTSPYPCRTFYDLFRAHYPRWFLPKYKIWFSDLDLPGRLILVRYDQRRGCIEGYQLLANKKSRSFHVWDTEPPVMVHSFDPVVKLHIDNPVLKLPANPPIQACGSQYVGNIRTIRLRRDSADSADSSSRSVSRYQAEIPMQLNSIDNMRSNFVYAKILDPEDVQTLISSAFPYGHIWPPPTIPAPHRVVADGLGRSYLRPLGPESRPNNRRELCDRAFRIRKWIELRLFHSHGLALRPDPLILTGGFAEGEAVFPHAETDHHLIPDIPFLSHGIHGGDDISTYATLDPELYKPTPGNPYQGIWVGDYSGHGCEFLWIHHDDGRLPVLGYEPAIPRRRLLAVKLTGDANVPRGEFSWVVEDLGDGGLVRVEKEPPFEGVRVVKSQGHVANTGFLNDSYIDSHLFLISHDRLAQHWIDLERVSFYQRVDIDQFLVPD